MSSSFEQSEDSHRKRLQYRRPLLIRESLAAESCYITSGGDKRERDASPDGTHRQTTLMLVEDAMIDDTSNSKRNLAQVCSQQCGIGSSSKVGPEGEGER